MKNEGIKSLKGLVSVIIRKWACTFPVKFGMSHVKKVIPKCYEQLDCVKNIQFYIQ